MSGARGRGLEVERSHLDLARSRAEAAARAYRRALVVAGRGTPRPRALLRASRSELACQRQALAVEIERFGALACATAEDAVPLALAFRAARETLQLADLLAQGRKGRGRMAPKRTLAASPPPL
ncbi:MAG TPA: hypothetical protein VFE33_10015 [Thermoanaerobaculia bacterium]|nr:hypothetical protein [Thermoanaerobaculia bacterium]